MPNVLNASGLTTATQAELLANFTTAYQQIYGPNIDLSSSTPDGQMMNIYIQAIIDLENLLTQIYNSFNPQLAIGNVLDQRCAINGITRRAGTYTVTPITVVTSSSVNLYGLDQTDQPVYTVSDNSGNQWQLITTQLGVSTGSHSFDFQAALPGATITIPNTITVQVTIVLGVVSVNNPSTYTTLGTNEESDAQLRLRRQISVSLGSQGYYQGLLGALESINGVTSAFIYENFSATTDADGVPGHSIWVIVAGTGAAADIANAIYQKRNAGCGMFGSQSYMVNQINGTTFTVFWDNVVPVNLFIYFNASSINGTTAPNVSGILSGLPTSFVPSVFGEVNINGLATLVQDIDPNTLVTNAGFSDGYTQILTLSGIAASGTFVLNYNGATSSAINWNDNISTIQSKLQAMTGLSTATVSGSIASQTLTFDLSSIIDVQGLLYVTNNTLMTSVPAAISFSYNEGYANILLPASKKDQFIVSSANIIIVPILLTPIDPTVAPTDTIDFLAYGGYGAHTFSLSVNNSGGSINSSTGVYTAGSTPLVTDTVKVTDVLGNFSTMDITVT